MLMGPLTRFFALLRTALSHEGRGEVSNGLVTPGRGEGKDD